MQDFTALEQKVNVHFNDKDLLKKAFVHRSYINEHPDFEMGHNERLEFLGDAVLELIVTEYLFRHHHNAEGDLTAYRASLVNSRMLSQVGNALDFNNYLLLSKGESKDSEGRARAFIIADAVEAFIGAMYLDQGLETTKKFIIGYVIVHLGEVLEKKLYQDPKSALQEKAQEKKGVTPRYEVMDERGPDHQKLFQVGVYFDKEMIADGRGSNKQEAEEKAAKKALEKNNW